MKKRFAKRGFTLTEMLISVLLLGLVSVMTTVMTSAVLSTTSVMQDISQAEILGNEVLENIQGVLRVAYSVEIDKTNEGDGTCELVIAIDQNNTDYRFALDKDGKIILGQYDKENKVDGDPLFSGVSYGDLKVESLKFEANDGANTVEVSVSVSRFGKPIWTGNVTVRPLCGVSKIKTASETG